MLWDYIATTFMKLDCEGIAYIWQYLSYIWQYLSVYNISYKYTCVWYMTPVYNKATKTLICIII